LCLSHIIVETKRVSSSYRVKGRVQYKTETRKGQSLSQDTGTKTKTKTKTMTIWSWSLLWTQ